MLCPFCNERHNPFFLEHFVSQVTSPATLAGLAGSGKWWIRLQVVHNPYTPENVIRVLTIDAYHLVREAARLRLEGKSFVPGHDDQNPDADAPGGPPPPPAPPLT